MSRRNTKRVAATAGASFDGNREWLEERKRAWSGVKERREAAEQLSCDPTQPASRGGGRAS